MTNAEAISIVLDVACRWGENEEEGFARRINATDTDAELATLGDELDEVKLVRDLWQAVALLNKNTGTVAAYFATQLGRAPTDESLADMPAGSPCGQECVRAIDAAQALRGSMAMAWGDDSREAAKIVDLAERACAVFICG